MQFNCGLVTTFELIGFFSNYVSQWWGTHILQNKVCDEGFTFCFALHLTTLPFVGYALWWFYIFASNETHVDFGCLLYVF